MQSGGTNVRLVAGDSGRVTARQNFRARVCAHARLWRAPARMGAGVAARQPLLDQLLAVAARLPALKRAAVSALALPSARAPALGTLVQRVIRMATAMHHRIQLNEVCCGACAVVRVHTSTCTHGHRDDANRTCVSSRPLAPWQSRPPWPRLLRLIAREFLTPLYRM
jgi:hypothetical protein